MRYIVVLLVILSTTLLSNIHAVNIYGSNVHWRPYKNSDRAIVFSYRLIWEMDPRICDRVANNPVQFKLCTEKQVGGGYSTQIGTIPRAIQNYSWACSNSVISNLSELYYTDIGRFYDVSWESAVESIVYTFDNYVDLSNIRIRFLAENQAVVEDIGEVYINMATRNDTNRPNISPLVNVFPVYKVPEGCSINIKLFPFDGDGDYVTCHWEHFKNKTIDKTGFVLYEDLCELHFYADPNNYTTGDTKTISLYAQDYSTKPVKMSGVSNDVTSGPFSRTPIKLFVKVGDATRCVEGPEFTREGTREPNFKWSYRLPFQDARLPFEVPHEDEELLTSGPRFMVFRERVNSTRIDEGVWDYLNDTSMKGIHQVCGLAYTKYGVPGDSRCAVFLVEEPNECLSNPCKPGGICDNLFEYYTCTYPDDPVYNGHIWTSAKSCQDRILREKGDDNTALKIGLPVGLSLFWLIVLVAVSCYMKRYFTEKFRNTTVEPEEMMTGVKNGLTNPI